MKKLVVILLVMGLSLAMVSTEPVTLNATDQSTDWVQLNNEIRVEFNVAVLAVSTNVVVRPESAFYQASSGIYYPMSLMESTTLGVQPKDVTFNVTGNFRIHKDSGIASKYVRLKLIRFAGSTPNILVNITGK
jgi:hypothetical protein